MKFVSIFGESEKRINKWLYNINSAVSNIPNTTQAVLFACAVVLLVSSRITSAQLRGIIPVINRDRDAVAVKHVYEPNSDGSYVYRCGGVTCCTISAKYLM